MKKRNLGLDMARILAIFFVIMAHVYTDAYNLSNTNIHNLSASKLWSGYIGFTIGRLGVPLFLMLTGYFLLARVWTPQKISHFFKNNLVPLLITWEIWIAIYFLYNKYYAHMTGGIKNYIEQTLFLKSVPMPNAWYMPMIIGIYLFLPYVGIALSKISSRILFWFLLIIYIYLFIVPTVSQAIGLLGRPALVNQLELSFSGGIYAFYMLIGYCIKRFDYESLGAKYKLIGALISLLLFIVTVSFQILSYQWGKTYNVWYDFLTLPIISAYIFSIFRKMQLVVNKKLIVKISDCSFGIFLIHYPILVVLTKTIIPYKRNFFFLLMLTFIVYLVSLLIVFIINRNKKIGRLLFFK